MILIDTSVLIDYYRKKDKSKSYLYKLSQRNPSCAVSVITQYEIYVGALPDQIAFWDTFFFNLTVLPFDSKISITAVAISKELKKQNKQIDVPDLFIAATALFHNLPCATLNQKHFQRIANLELVEL